MRPRSVLAAAAAAAAVLAAAGCGGGGSGSLPLPQIGPAGVTPPAGAVVDAREWGSRDLAVARKDGTVTVSVVGPEGGAVGGLDIRVGGQRATACGAGCYSAPDHPGPVVVRSGGETFRFDIPQSAPSGASFVEKIEQAFAHLHTVALHQRLAGSPTSVVVTSFRLVAPGSLRYENVGGSQAVVIGNHRWDRPSATGRWTRSQQTPVKVMHVPWRRSTDEHMVAPHTVTFFDPGTRAWFRVVADAETSLPLTVKMIGVSHFMHDRFTRFDEPMTISPPR